MRISRLRARDRRGDAAVAGGRTRHASVQSVSDDAAVARGVASGRRLAAELQTPKSVSVLEPESPGAPMPAGYNPYFDLPPA